MTKRERTRATAGDRIAAKASAEFGYPGDVPIEDLARRIDAAVKRNVDAERAGIAAALRAHMGQVRTNLVGGVPLMVDQWEQCLRSFERLMDDMNLK